MLHGNRGTVLVVGGAGFAAAIEVAEGECDPVRFYQKQCLGVGRAILSSVLRRCEPDHLFIERRGVWRA